MWKQARTAEKIRTQAKAEKRLIPLAFESFVRMGSKTAGSDEERLRWSLEIIGVLEQRRSGKINVPDIFRVAARIKRRGGVKPPPRARRAA